MSSQIIKNSGHTAYGLKEYVVDTLQELNNLSIDDPQGSLATVINGGNLKHYMMNGNHEWKEVTLNGGSGGGGETANINTIIVDAWYDESGNLHPYQYKINNSLTYDKAKQTLIDSKSGVPTIIEFKVEHRQGEAQSSYRNFWFYDASKNVVGRFGKYLVDNVVEIDENEVEYHIRLDQFYYAYIQFSWDDSTQTITVGNGDINYVSVYPYDGLTNSTLPYFRDNIEFEGVSFPFAYICPMVSSTTLEITSDTLLDTIAGGLSSFDQYPTHYYINDINLYSAANAEEPEDMVLTQIPATIEYVGGMFPAGSIEELISLSEAKIRVSTSDASPVKMVIINGMTDFDQLRNPINIDY